MLNKAPQLSSLEIDAPILISFLNDNKLCECLSKRIKKLNISL
jgi:hypothetical protein